MKRIFTALFITVIVLSGVVFGGVSAMAQTIQDPNIVTRSGGVLVMNSFNPVIFMDANTGSAAYCIDNNRHVPVAGSVQGTLDPATIFAPDVYEGFQDLLLAGYPFQTGGLSDIEAQECTQLAVWTYTYVTMGYGLSPTMFSPANGQDAEYAFFTSVLNAGINRTKPDLGLSADDVYMTANGDTMTGQTTVTFNNLQGGYTIDESKLPDGVTVSGYTGNDGDVLTFTAPLSFAGQYISLSDILQGHDTRSTLNLFWYGNIYPDEQRMAYPVMDETAVAVTAGINMNFEPVGTVNVTKVSASDNSPLSGAVFDIYDVNGQHVATLTTGQDGTASVTLSYGYYQIVEQIAPDGFRLNDQQYTAYLTPNTPEADITVTDEPTSGTLHVTKSDGNGNYLPGAKFAVYYLDTNGVPYLYGEFTTGADGTGEITLPPDNFIYYLVEESAPDGYQLSDNPISFTITDGQTTDLDVVNIPIPPAPTTGTLQIVKTDDTTNIFLPGAVYGIYDAATDTEVTELTTDQNGAASAELPAGDYYAVELQAPSGYQLSTDKTSFTISVSNTTMLTLQDSLLPVATPTGFISIVKQADITGNPLPGAVFGIYRADDDTKVMDLMTGADGTTTSAALTVGDYYALETQAPAGFQINPNRFDVTVNDGETAVITVTDMPVYIPPVATPTGFISIIKTDDTGNIRLPGAVFGIYNAADNTKVAELTTGADGTTTSAALTVGDYYALESQAPDGFQLNPNKYNVTVNDDETVVITVTDRPVPADTTPPSTPSPATPVPSETPSSTQPSTEPAVTPTEPAAPEPTTGELLLIKKADGTGDPLANAVFGVYLAPDGTEVTELTTGADGQAVLSLDAGTYFLKELQAPYGFVIDPAEIDFTVTAGGTVKIEVTDQRNETIPDAPQSNIDMPKTGETFPITDYILGAALLIIAAICATKIIKARKKSKKPQK